MGYYSRKKDFRFQDLGVNQEYEIKINNINYGFWKLGGPNNYIKTVD
jgi:hypothetical protein